MKRERGYTLVEVLVALAIVSVAITAVFHALQVSTHSSRQVGLRSLALHAAQNTLAELYLQRAFPQPGLSTKACPLGPYPFSCEIESKKTMHAQFRQITIRVHLENEPNALSTLYGTLARAR